MLFILLSVIFYQNMLDHILAKPIYILTRFPYIDLSKVGGQADFTNSELHHDWSCFFALARPIFKHLLREHFMDLGAPDRAGLGPSQFLFLSYIGLDSSLHCRSEPDWSVMPGVMFKWSPLCYGGGFLSELVDGLIAPDVGMGTDPAEFDVNATVSKLLDVS